MRQDVHSDTTAMAQPAFQKSLLHGQPNGTSTPFAATNPKTLSNAASSASTAYPCQGCVHEGSDEDGNADHIGDEEQRYNDSEYVDDEVTSLLNNAFLQIGKTPSDEAVHRHSQNGSHSYSNDEESIEVVIADQRDKILRPTLDHVADDEHHDGSLTPSRNSWSSASTHSQKPFAPITKKKKSGAANNNNSNTAKGRGKSKECHRNHVAGHSHRTSPEHHRLLHQHQPHQTHSSGINSTYGATGRSPHPPAPPSGVPRPDHATHLRRTSFPRLKTQSSVYSTHDNLDHALADDREHADLTEIGIQTALTIAVHKFPEGMITFLSTTADPCLGLSVVIAISVHNLIEGYLIAFPLYIGLHSRAKAFALAAALGGLSQPLGAVLGWFILRKVASLGWKVSATGCIYAVVAGMMASIAVNGMWPQAVKCVGRNKTKVVQYSFFGGIAVMGICQAVMGTKCEF
ncbi:hypothetical protein BGX28_000966 [Mortierella sp. GBA30]|nr:hypothetical protein BGX28_000966 [Mortierella sp. GBA30]